MRVLSSNLGNRGPVCDTFTCGSCSSANQQGCRVHESWFSSVHAKGTPNQRTQQGSALPLFVKVMNRQPSRRRVLPRHSDANARGASVPEFEEMLRRPGPPRWGRVVGAPRRKRRGGERCQPSRRTTRGTSNRRTNSLRRETRNQSPPTVLSAVSTHPRSHQPSPATRHRPPSDASRRRALEGPTLGERGPPLLRSSSSAWCSPTLARYRRASCARAIPTQDSCISPTARPEPRRRCELS
jgi:hypothetical protein